MYKAEIMISRKAPFSRKLAKKIDENSVQSIGPPGSKFFPRTSTGMLISRQMRGYQLSAIRLLGAYLRPAVMQTRISLTTG
jgi:hypothetical protein